MPLIERSLAAELGRDTVRILDEGGYRSPSGAWIDLSGRLEHAIRGTNEYPPNLHISDVIDRETAVTITVENESVLVVGRRLASDGAVAILNFASGTHPGGGFLAGARAQEETIARSSGLFACLKGREMYAFHRRMDDAMSSDYVIYSPDVPVFRADEGELLEQPWLASIVTCPAANASILSMVAPERLAAVPAIMRERARKVLSVAVRHDVHRLVLGAWGCGAFGIDPSVMADIFHHWLTTGFARAFDTVVFAITDWSDDQHFITPFRNRFA